MNLEKFFLSKSMGSKYLNRLAAYNLVKIQYILVIFAI